MATSALLVDSGDGPLGSVLGVDVVRQRARGGLVEVVLGSDSREINLPVNVAGLLGNKVEQVSTAVPAAEGGETPVSAEGGNDRVVGVEGVVLGSLEVLGDGAAKEDGVDAVLLGIGGGLVEGDKDEGVLSEVVILQERGHEAVEPLAGEGDVGVVGIVGHVGGDEHVLGQTVVLQVLVEGGEVLDLTGTDSVVGDGVEEDQRIVLAHVVIGFSLGVAEALVTYIKDNWLAGEVPIAKCMDARIKE